jgi:hypothetical protein
MRNSIKKPLFSLLLLTNVSLFANPNYLDAEVETSYEQTNNYTTESDPGNGGLGGAPINDHIYLLAVTGALIGLYVFKNKKKTV